MKALEHALVIVFCLWLLLGALPQMRRDAAEKGTQVRGLARERMRTHAKAKPKGRIRIPQWWGWTLMWGTVATAQEGARFGGYMVRSAWRGWGDHRRRAEAAVETAKAKWFPPEPSQPEVTEPPQAEPPQPEPPRGGGGTEPPQAEPPQWDDPLPEPPREETEPPRPEPPADAPGWNDPLPEPVPAGAGGGDVIPFAPRNSAVNNEGEQVTDEIQDLESAKQVVLRMQASAQRSLDEAIAEKERTAQALKDVEQASNDLAAAGVSGPVMDAFIRYHEAMEQADMAARAEVVAYDAAVQAANAARGALAKHEDAAEALRATQGAANSTEWYGPQAG